MASFLCLSSFLNDLQKKKKKKACWQQDQCWEQENLCCGCMLFHLVWSLRARQKPVAASCLLNLVVFMISSATAVNNWKAKSGLFSVFMRVHPVASEKILSGWKNSRVLFGSCFYKSHELWHWPSWSLLWHLYADKKKYAVRWKICGYALHICCFMYLWTNEIQDHNNNLYIKMSMI